MATIYLIPSLLHEEGVEAIPAYILKAARDCQVFFVENERTARRFLKQLDRSIVIDDYEWFTMDKDDATGQFRKKLQQDITIGILSEAGCPGVADPGQALIAIAQEKGALIKPLTGPNSILLALMASGMNGQHFRFNGYLPIDNHERIKKLKDLEAESFKQNLTQVFIETPYRNNQMAAAILQACKPTTKLCIAADLTGKNEWIKTRKVSQWQNDKPDIHKKPAIFLLEAK